MLASPSSHSSIVIGPKPSKSSPDFVSKVLSYCGRRDAPICLVNAQDEKLELPTFYSGILGNFDSTELDLSGGQSQRGQALERLEEIKTTLEGSETMQVRVCDAEDPATALIEHAKSLRATLIAIEVEPHLYQLIPSGLSVALRLMQHSPIPVLLLRKGTPDPFKGPRRTLLIADDLTNASNSALQHGLSLALAWGNTHVIHTHVIEENYQKYLQEYQDSGQQARSDIFGMMDLIDYVKDRIAGMLRYRASDFRGKGVGTYETVVHYGNVAQKIDFLLKERAPDLVVFGRHQKVRLHPFGIGKVPFAAMIANSNAVLLTP